jgi:protein-disulfide isomerase
MSCSRLGGKRAPDAGHLNGITVRASLQDFAAAFADSAVEFRAQKFAPHRRISRGGFVIRWLTVARVLPVAFLALAAIGVLSLRHTRDGRVFAAPLPQALQGVTDIDPHKAFGSKNAPMVMEVFSDFQCPACKTLYTTTNRLILDNYVNTGRIYLIHRDFPLPMHAYSRVAARYARAAAQMGKVEPVEQVLFETQEKWEVTGDVDGTVASVLSPAEMAKVRALVKGGTLDAAIDKDYSLGQTYHVNQTPTTIVHAKGQTYPVIGVVSYDVLHKFLDQLLSP